MASPCEPWSARVARMERSAIRVSPRAPRMSEFPPPIPDCAPLPPGYRCFAASSLQYHARQPEGEFGEVGDEHQHCEHDPVERPDPPHHLLDRDLADRAADEERRADRGMAEADAEIEQHDHAEVN